MINKAKVVIFEKHKTEKHVMRQNKKGKVHIINTNILQTLK